MKIDEMGYVWEMRQSLGLDENDTSRDAEIEAMTPMRRVELVVGWYLGDPKWAVRFRNFFENQGLWLTTNPDADGVMKGGD
jgi:hypothetical protein